MPAVLDTPEVVDAEAYELTEAQPSVRPSRAGFWHTMMQYVRWQSVSRCRRPSSRRLPVQKFEAPADLLARQYPTLFIQACAGV